LKYRFDGKEKRLSWGSVPRCKFEGCPRPPRRSAQSGRRWHRPERWLRHPKLGV